MIQADIAKSFNKEFKILLKKGIVVPPEYLKGVIKYQIFEWKTEKELAKIFISLLGKKGDINITNPYENA